MNMTTIIAAVENAERLLDQLESGDELEDVIGPASVFLWTSRARAEAEHARVRSPEQLFVRRLLLSHIEQLERKALGTA